MKEKFPDHLKCDKCKNKQECSSGVDFECKPDDEKFIEQNYDKNSSKSHS